MAKEYHSLTIDAEEYLTDTVLLGITATYKNFQFCWQVNNVLEFNFCLDTESIIEMKKKNRTYFFPLYVHKNEDTHIYHHIYTNVSDGEYLLPEYKHMDFLWMVHYDALDDISNDTKTLIADIKKLSSVLMVSELPADTLKNKWNLLL